MNLNRIVAIILIIGFLVPTLGILLASNCDKDITNCLLEKEYLMPDFYWHYNVIRFVSVYGELPDYVLDNEDGGWDGSSLEGKQKRVSHAPLYYFLSAGVLIFARSMGLNSILALHIFSVILMLIGNILFFLLLKKISRNMDHKNQFIIFAILASIFIPTSLYVSLAIQGHSLFYLFMMLSFYIYIKFLKEKTFKNAILLGLVLSLCLLSSLAGLPLLVVLGIHLLWDYLKKKRKEGTFLLIPILLGGLCSTYIMVRNYVLYGDFIWGSEISSIERNFFVLVRLVKAFFGGIFGGYELISPLIWIASILIIILSIYGFFCFNLKNKWLSFMWMSGLLTIILAIHSVCNINIILKNMECIGGSIVHGRYLLNVIPLLSISFSMGFVNIFKGKYNLIKLFVILLMCLLYAFDFIYALV